MLVLVTTLLAFVRGAVIAELAEQEAQRRTGLSTLQWQARMAPYIAALMESGKYPAFNRIIADAKLPHSGADEGFARGLDLVLNGLAASIPAPDRPAAPVRPRVPRSRPRRQDPPA